MKCENCKAYNAQAISIHDGEDKQVLCPRCLQILKSLDQEYQEIVE